MTIGLITGGNPRYRIHGTEIRINVDVHKLLNASWKDHAEKKEIEHNARYFIEELQLLDKTIKELFDKSIADKSALKEEYKKAEKRLADLKEFNKEIELDAKDSIRNANIIISISNAILELLGELDTLLKATTVKLGRIRKLPRIIK